jgi:hypothetical protein
MPRVRGIRAAARLRELKRALREARSLAELLARLEGLTD